MADSEFHLSSVEDLQRLRSKLDRAGLKLVFTNGCFDLLHTGHVRYLRQARGLGDAMVVAVNSDASVKALKGPSRPVTPESERAELLAELRCVDAVTIFADARVTDLITQVRPHIYAKGGDYTVDSLDPDERAALEKAGSEICILPLVPGRSTTTILQKLADEAAPPAPATDADGNPPLRLVVLGSSRGSNFQALLGAIQAGNCHAKVEMAITDTPDSGFAEIARGAGVALETVDAGPNPLRTAPAAQDRLMELLTQTQPDVIVLAGYLRILRSDLIAAFPDRIVNVHPSLLPAYKGRNAVQAALDAGELETGCTIHLVTEEIDAGRILAQEKVPIQIGDDAAVLHARIQEKEHQVLPRVLHEWRQQGLPVASV